MDVVQVLLLITMAFGIIGAVLEFIANRKHMRELNELDERLKALLGEEEEHG